MIDDGVFEGPVTSSDTHFDGEDFDSWVVTYFYKTGRKHKKDICANAQALLPLHTVRDRAKMGQWSSANALIEVVQLHDRVDLYTSISRSDVCAFCIALFTCCSLLTRFILTRQP